MFLEWLRLDFKKFQAYVDDEEVVERIERGEGAVPIILLKPDRPDILARSSEIEGYGVCDRIQIIVDLFSGGLGRDAAMKFLEVIQRGDEKDSG